MSFYSKIAQILMNLSPNFPLYNEIGFKQEDFKNPSFISLTKKGKNEQIFQWIINDIKKYSEFQFEKYFPEFQYEKYIKGKTVLDVGCSIGGLTMHFAEEYKVDKMFGIDCHNKSIDAVNNYIIKEQTLTSEYTFVCAKAEQMPFDDHTFDAIISNDTFEHVRNIRKTLIECKRVTKPGGIILLVFPSYHFPLGGGHIEMVTNTLFLEWIFSPKILNQAIINITSKWDSRYNWFLNANENSEKIKWLEVESGIGINGVTYNEFNSVVNDLEFSKVKFIKSPIASCSTKMKKLSFRKYFIRFNFLLLRTPFLIDHLSYRLVYIIRV
tara:strand:+ start:765 stop:1739 length:975 start_codon:yes stop_codon:yes gene_type:complete